MESGYLVERSGQFDWGLAVVIDWSICATKSREGRGKNPRGEPARLLTVRRASKSSGSTLCLDDSTALTTGSTELDIELSVYSIESDVHGTDALVYGLDSLVHIIDALVHTIESGVDSVELTVHDVDSLVYEEAAKVVEVLRTAGAPDQSADLFVSEVSRIDTRSGLKPICLLRGRRSLVRKLEEVR